MKPHPQNSVKDDTSLTPKEVVLVVEDSPPNLKILVHTIKKLGFDTIEFKNGEEARKFLENPEQVKLVLIVSDIAMPNMSGLQLLEWVRKHPLLSQTPFVLVSALSDKDTILEAKKFQTNGYLVKPLDIQRITNLLKSLFPNRQFPPLTKPG